MIAYSGMNLVSLNPYMNTPLHRRDFLRIVRSSAIGLTIKTPLYATPNKGLIESTSSKNMSISGEQPNIIMFVMDDLNDWVTPLDIHKPTLRGAILKKLIFIFYSTCLK